jgi:4-hydroxy-3-polyprenylbenzoate decarboxylase
MSQDRFFVGITGASGVLYGLRTIRALCDLGHHVDVAVTDAGRKVLAMETGVRLDAGSRDASPLLGSAGSPRGVVRLFDNAAIEAGPSSGTYPLKCVILVPCSMGTVGRIASGYSSCLIERVADVALKEARPLIVVPRETPFSRIHLDHLNRLAWAGAHIVPAMPAFYQLPKSIDDLVDHMVAKILDAARVAHTLSRRWGVPRPAADDAGPHPDRDGLDDPGGLGEGCDP